MNIKGTTPSGFVYSVSDTLADDMEFLDSLAAFEAAEDPAALSIMVDRMFDKAQKKALYKHCRQEDGHVSTRAVIDEVVAIFHGVGAESEELKN